jgi:lipopolysaccharide/colanic/teichoic acid biosynthesis glycosyltransferase
MSLVGPRPELPFLVERYEAWERKRFAVPPGMTGWWQTRGRSDRPMHLHVEDDLYYIQNYSLLLDLQILWKTVGVVLRRSGAY